MIPYGTKFPETLSLLPQIAFWEIDEVVVFFLVFGVGYFTHIVICLIAPFAAYFYIKAKKNQPRGFMQHMMYRFGQAELKGYPSYFEDHFVE